MLVDGLTVTAGGGIGVAVIGDNRGPTLPQTAAVGDLWELTAPDGINPQGVYEYTLLGWNLRNPSSNLLTFDVSGTVYGKPNVGDKVLMFVSPRTFELAGSYAGGVAQALVPPQSTQDFSVNLSRSGSLGEIGIIRFQPNSYEGQFIPSTSEKVIVRRGDMLVVFAPFNLDPMIEDISFTLCGHLSV